MPISAEGSLAFRFLQVHFSNELRGDEAVRGTCRCVGLQPRSARPRRAEPCSPRRKERERGAHKLAFEFSSGLTAHFGRFASRGKCSVIPGHQ